MIRWWDFNLPPLNPHQTIVESLNRFKTIRLKPVCRVAVPFYGLIKSRERAITPIARGASNKCKVSKHRGQLLSTRAEIFLIEFHRPDPSISVLQLMRPSR